MLRIKAHSQEQFHDIVVQGLLGLLSQSYLAGNFLSASVQPNPRVRFDL